MPTEHGLRRDAEIGGDLAGGEEALAHADPRARTQAGQVTSAAPASPGEYIESQMRHSAASAPAAIRMTLSVARGCGCREREIASSTSGSQGTFRLFSLNASVTEGFVFL